MKLCVCVCSWGLWWDSPSVLGPLSKGIAYDMSLAGASLIHIAQTVVKTDGTHPCTSSVESCIALCAGNGGVAPAAESRCRDGAHDVPRNTFL